MIEALIYRKWQNHLNEIAENEILDDQKFINKARMKKLEGSQCTASIVTEILSLMGKLSFKDYLLIEEIRKARNKWMHDLSPAPMEKAIKSFQSACNLFYSEYCIKLPDGVGLRI